MRAVIMARYGGPELLELRSDVPEPVETDRTRGKIGLRIVDEA